MNKPDLKSPLGNNSGPGNSGPGNPGPGSDGPGNSTKSDKSDKSDKPDKKKDVEPSQPAELVNLATGMWWVVCGLQILHGLLLAFILPTKPRFISEQLKNTDFDKTLAQSGLSETQMLVAMGVMVALMFIVLSAIFAILSLLVRKGKGWPRWILIGGSLYLAVSGAQVFFSKPQTTESWFIWGDGIAMILSGLLGVVASYVITRPELGEFFGDPKDFPKDENGKKKPKDDQKQ